MTDKMLSNHMDLKTMLASIIGTKHTTSLLDERINKALIKDDYKVLSRQFVVLQTMETTVRSLVALSYPLRIYRYLYNIYYKATNGIDEYKTDRKGVIYRYDEQFGHICLETSLSALEGILDDYLNVEIRAEIDRIAIILGTLLPDVSDVGVIFDKSKQTILLRFIDLKGNPLPTVVSMATFKGGRKANNIVPGRMELLLPLHTNIYDTMYEFKINGSIKDTIKNYKELFDENNQIY